MPKWSDNEIKQVKFFKTCTYYFYIHDQENNFIQFVDFTIQNL